MAIKCTTGKPCGNTCIAKSDVCALGTQTAKVLNKLVAGASVPRVASSEVKQKALDELDLATTPEEKAAAVKALMLRLPPETLKEIEAHMGAFGDSDASKGIYELPGMKRRKVDDQEVDAAWDALTPQQRDILFSPNAGAPGRGQFDLRQSEWGGDINRMRRSMLKAMLEQSDDDGNIIDPWTGKPLVFPADLDHILPIAQGGGHGSPSQGSLNSGYASDNWVWISPEVNRYYKGDGDVNETYALIKEHIAQGDKGFKDAVDAKIADLDGNDRQLKDLAKQVEQGILAQYGKTTDPAIIPQIPLPQALAMISKPELESIIKAIDNGGIIQNRAGVRGLDAKDLKTVVQGILQGISEETRIAAAVIRAESIIAKFGKGSSLSKVETNNAMKSILTKPDIDSPRDTEMHRVVDRLMLGRPGPLMPAKYRKMLERAPRLPLKRMSLAPWALTRINQKIPDLKTLTAKEKSEMWDYINKNLEK